VKPGTYVAASLLLPFELGGVRVTINGALAPLLAVVITSSGQAASAQINFQVPLDRNAFIPAVEVGYPEFLDVVSASTDVVLAEATPLPAQPAWGGFFADANGYAIAQHASDYSLVTPQNPAHAGEAIIVYADDFFPVWPPPPVGFPTPQQPLFQILSSHLANVRGGPPNYLYLQDYPQPTCIPPPAGACGQSFANTPALKVTFEGLAPGQIGVEQINFVVPANQAPGDWALFFNEGSCPDGIGPPDRCATGGGRSSPYVKLPVR